MEQAIEQAHEEHLEDRVYVAKKWGLEEWLVNNPLYCAKLLWITPGYMCSLHYHKTKHETFCALDGLIRVEYYLEGGKRRVDTILVGWRRDVLTLPPNTPHRFFSMGGDGGLLLEVSTTHDDADVVRIVESREIGGEEEQ